MHQYHLLTKLTLAYFHQRDKDTKNVFSDKKFGTARRVKGKKGYDSLLGHLLTLSGPILASPPRLSERKRNPSVDSKVFPFGLKLRKQWKGNYTPVEFFLT